MSLPALSAAPAPARAVCDVCGALHAGATCDICPLIRRARAIAHLSEAARTAILDPRRYQLPGYVAYRVAGVIRWALLPD